jgi:hypothetical protein
MSVFLYVLVLLFVSVLFYLSVLLTCQAVCQYTVLWLGRVDYQRKRASAGCLGHIRGT